jgi:thioredoxin-like negative regulator of GroEL
MFHLALALAALAFAPDQEAFRSITFEQAQTAALREQKVILIDFFTTWCVPCKKLDRTTWKDAAVVKWIGDHCVAVKLDAEQNVELAKRFHVDVYPTVLLLKADGRVIDRLVGYKDAQDFVSSATAALAGEDSLARAQARLAGHEQDPERRQRYAGELKNAGKYEEALAEYLWCFDEGKSSEAYSGVRRSFLLYDIERLGHVFPAAIKALEQRRDAAESRIRAGSTAFDDVADAFALNARLGTPERSMALFDELKKAGPIAPRVRFHFFLQLKASLVEAKRYDDLLGLLDDPVGYVVQSIESYERTRKLSESADEKQKEMPERTDTFQRTRAVEDGVLVYETLLAAGRGPEADKVSGCLVGFEATGKTYVALIRAAARAGAAERVTALGERGLAALPEKDQAPVRKAVARAAKAK